MNTTFFNNGLVSKIAATACAALFSTTFVLAAVAPAHVVTADQQPTAQTA